MRSVGRGVLPLAVHAHEGHGLLAVLAAVACAHGCGPTRSSKSMAASAPTPSAPPARQALLLTAMAPVWSQGPQPVPPLQGTILFRIIVVESADAAAARATPSRPGADLRC